MNPRFGTAINCIDGRAQLPVIQWLCESFGVDHVDLITEPGADGVLAKWRVDALLSIKSRTRLSVEAHGSEVVAVAGHHDCRANPVSAEQHMLDIKAAVEVVKSWRLPAPVVGLWVDETWRVVVVVEQA